MWLFFREAFTRFDFTGDCQQTRVELCACTSDRERSTRAGEACTSDRQPVNANPDSDSHSVCVNVASLPSVRAYLAGVKAGRVHLCRVAANTV